MSYSQSLSFQNMIITIELTQGRKEKGENDEEAAVVETSAEEREKKKGRGWGLKRALGLKR